MPVSLKGAGSFSLVRKVGINEIATKHILLHFVPKKNFTYSFQNMEGGCYLHREEGMGFPRLVELKQTKLDGHWEVTLM